MTSYDLEMAQAVLTRHYVVLVFLVSLGSLQLGASVGGLTGLWLLPGKQPNIGLAVGTTLFGILLFTLMPLWTDGPWASGSMIDGTSEARKWGTASWDDLTKARILNDIHGGLNGGDYGAWFPLTALAAVSFSVVVGAVRMRVFGGAANSGDLHAVDGFRALERTHWFAAARTSWARLRRTVWRDLLSLLVATPNWTLPKLVARRWLRD